MIKPRVISAPSTGTPHINDPALEPSHGDLPFRRLLGIEVLRGGQTRPLWYELPPAPTQNPPATHLVGLFSQVPRRSQIPSEGTRMIDSRSRKGGRDLHHSEERQRAWEFLAKTRPDRSGGSGWGSDTGEKKAASEHNLNVTPFKQTLLTNAAEFLPPRHFLDRLK